MINNNRILHFPGFFNSGGVEAVLINLYRNINKEKYQFDFCVPRVKSGQYDKEIIQSGGKIISIPKIRDVGIIKYIYIIAKIISENGPYLAVHIHSKGYNGIYSVIAAKISGVKKIIYHVHSTSDKSFDRYPFSGVLKIISASFIKILCSDLLACSYDAANFIYGKNYTRKNKITILNNAIDFKQYKPYAREDVVKLRKRFAVEDDTIFIGNAARFTEGKNQDVLIRMINKMKNHKVILLLAGDGETKSDCKKLAHTLNVQERVIFCGQLSDNEMPEFYNTLDVFLLPSDFEGLGISIIEAEACGIPCIVSNGVPQYSDIGSGLWHRISFDNANSECINLVLEISGDRTYNREQLINKIEQAGYSIFDSVKHLEKLYSN